MASDLKRVDDGRIAFVSRGSGVVMQKDSDAGNRTPGYRVRGDNVSHYTISDVFLLVQLTYSISMWL